MASVLITGCDTGIGREFARQYAGAGHCVLATYQNIAAQPQGPQEYPGQIRHFPLDVTDFDQFAALKRQLGDEPIDVLISNAGIGLDTGKFGALDYDYIRRMLAVNTLGPLKLVESFADNLAAGVQRRLVFVTSRMGSIEANLSGGHYGYRASKAGLNAMARSLAVDLFPRGITVTLIHPGWVKTAGGGDHAALSVEESVAGMRDTIRRLGNHETGQFLNYTGNLLPW